ncbi:MAG: OadG family protein [Chloroflexi bacterium]|nr:OadG family protein [Chloroflexota bacterium]
MWEQIWPNFQMGLQVTAIGMALVFIALIIVMLAIRLLDRLFRPESEKAAVASVRTTTGMTATVAVAPSAAQATAAQPGAGNLADEATAIALAIVLEQRKQMQARKPVQQPAEDDDYEVVGEVITVTTIDPGSGVWSGQGRLNAMH